MTSRDEKRGLDTLTFLIASANKLQPVTAGDAGGHWLGSTGHHSERGARAYTGCLGAEPSPGTRGGAFGPGVRRRQHNTEHSTCDTTLCIIIGDLSTCRKCCWDVQGRRCVTSALEGRLCGSVTSRCCRAGRATRAVVQCWTGTAPTHGSRAPTAVTSDWPAATSGYSSRRHGYATVSPHRYLRLSIIVIIYQPHRQQNKTTVYAIRQVQKDRKTHTNIGPLKHKRNNREGGKYR